MGIARTYPQGVTSWIDLEVPEQSDLDLATAFYGDLFGWTFEVATPGQGASTYLIARLEGQDAAGLGTPRRVPGSGTSTGPGRGWTTYVAVDDAEAVAASVERAGGKILQAPTDVNDAGRSALCADPEGARFGLWQAGRRSGAQVTNTPGAWNFSDLHTADPQTAPEFYTSLFGWEVSDLGFALMIRRPGYGAHLQATTDPEIHERQSGVGAPPGFVDAIGWVTALQRDELPHWHVTVTVADRDASVATVERLGGAVVRAGASDWTRDALVADPFGSEFTVSQFAPQS